MSFLLQEDDPLATLEEALAFIDACELDDSSSATASTASSSDEEAPSLRVFIRKTASGKLLLQHQVLVQQKQQPFVQPQYQQQPPQPTAKVSQAATNRARSVKKHRERKKNEVQMLREQATQLKARLLHYERVAAFRHGKRGELLLLQDARLSGSDALKLADVLRSDGVQSWFDVAAQQARERFESEALNLRLRDALVRQEQLTKSLVSAMNQTRAEGLELLLDHHKQELQFDRFTAPKVTAAPVTGIDELLVSLQQMYIATDSVVNMQSEMNLSTAMSSLSYVTQDELLAGKCIEVTTSMLLHCGFRDAGQAVWRRMSKMPQERENSASLGIFAMQSRELTSESFQKSYGLVVDLPDKQQPPLALHGTMYLHKFDEAGRYMIMWTSTAALPNGGPQFTEKNWIVLVPCPSQGSSSPLGGPLAIGKTVYQVSCDPQSLGVVSQETKEQIALVLKTLSRKKREYLLMMQDLLLDELSGFRHQPPTTAAPPVAMDVN